MFIRTISTIAVTASLLAAAPSPAPPDDLLAGPSVEDEVVDDAAMLEDARRKHGEKRRVSGFEIRIWIETLQSLELARDQEMEVQGILTDYRRKQREFHRTYAKDLQPKGRGSDAMNDMDREQREEQMQRMKEIRDKAPDPSEYQERAWKLLTEEQQAEFQIAYDQRLKDAIEKDEKRNRRDHDGQRDRPGDSPEANASDAAFGDGMDAPFSRRQDRPSDAVDDASLRRIKFLRRLQRLAQEQD
jgi:hypothetical protein